MTSVPNCFILGLLFLFLPLTSKLKTISFPSIIRCVEILRLHAESQVLSYSGSGLTVCVDAFCTRSGALVGAVDSGSVARGKYVSVLYLEQDILL